MYLCLYLPRVFLIMLLWFVHFRLDLSRNLLTLFPWNTVLFLPDLKVLKLNNNFLATFPYQKKLLNRLRKLQLIAMSANKFQCSCNFLKFLKWAVYVTDNNVLKLVDHDSLFCTTTMKWMTFGTKEYLMNKDFWQTFTCPLPTVKIYSLTTNDSQRSEMIVSTDTINNHICCASLTLYGSVNLWECNCSLDAPRDSSMSLTCDSHLANYTKTKITNVVAKTTLQLYRTGK